MDNDPNFREKISTNLVYKANLQQRVYDNTFSLFNTLKETLHEMASEFNVELDDKIDRRIRIEYRDRGKFEAQLRVAGEVLIFNMHTNVFMFDENNAIWQNEYVKIDRANAYCGVINIYNFLADSFKYNRSSDEGYLIGRIFINHELQYFVEGKRQQRVRVGEFGTKTIDEGELIAIIEMAMDYALDFDLLVPPYESAKIMNLDQLNTKFENTKIKTGKRLGYEFNIDDI